MLNKILICSFDSLSKRTFKSKVLYGSVVVIDRQEFVGRLNNPSKRLESMLHIIPENKLYCWNENIYELKNQGRLINLMFEISGLNSIICNMNRNIRKFYK